MATTEKNSGCKKWLNVSLCKLNVSSKINLFERFSLKVTILSRNIYFCYVSVDTLFEFLKFKRISQIQFFRFKQESFEAIEFSDCWIVSCFEKIWIKCPRWKE